MNGCDAECSGAATEVRREVGRDVHGECVCGGVGPGGWIRVRWMGERDKLHTSD